MKRESKYKIIKAVVACIAAIAAFYGTVLGIIQYHENRSGYDLNGEWALDLKIESTSYNPYKNLRVGYKIYLAQNDRYITGKGEKWWINGNETPFSQHDPIFVSGIIRDKDLPLSFTLKGSNRETVGIFNLEIMSNKKLIGTFSTTGANSRGSVVMSRPSNDI